MLARVRPRSRPSSLATAMVCAQVMAKLATKWATHLAAPRGDRHVSGGSFEPARATPCQAETLPAQGHGGDAQQRQRWE